MQQLVMHWRRSWSKDLRFWTMQLFSWWQNELRHFALNWVFYILLTSKGRNIAPPPPSPPCNLCSVRAPYRKQQTFQLWMEGTGEGCGFFCSQKLLYLSRMSRQFCCRLLIIHFVLLLNVCQASRALWQKCPYYINANKIPGELLCKNVTRNLSESSMSKRMLKTLSNGKSNVFFTVKNI